MNIYIKFFLMLALIWEIPLFASESDIYPIYLELKFDKDTDSVSYLWERKVLSDLYRDSSWAQESTAVDTTWKSIPELPRKVKVGVALGGGVVRGIAHIGVLRALEENNIPIHGISGTSMGAIIGGLYACGYSVDTLESIVKKSIDWKTFFSDQPPRQSLPLWERLREKPREPGLNFNSSWRWPPINFDIGSGLRVAQKFVDEIAERTLKADYQAGFKFDSLPIPFGAMLTNMKTGQSKLMREGTIATAVRASSSIPIAFEPMKIGGTQYVDGGILDNLPVDAFIPFDMTRAPDNMMSVIGKDTIDYYVIAVYPSKRRNVREVEKPEYSGFFGISVMNEASCLARDYHVWNSWKAAHGKIDVDVEGGFDFSPGKLEEMIRAGYDAAWKEIYWIKIDIAAMENRLKSAEQIQKIDICTALKRIHRLSSIKILPILEVDTATIKKNKTQESILKAIRLKEGSYVEKIDICNALRRIYNLGLFEDVKAKIVKVDRYWALTLLVKRKNRNYQNSIKVILKMDSASKSDTLIKKVEKVVEDTIETEKRILNFDEIKEIVERNLVEQGFVSPRVDSVKFNHAKETTDTLSIYGRKGIYLSGIKIIWSDTNRTKTEEDLNNEFGKSLSPKKVLKKTADVRKKYQLKTIAVEGIDRNSLVIAAKKKSAHTLEFPSITLENVEGLSLFGEVRDRSWRYWSPYLNYTRNFPMKETCNLPKGGRLEVGFERCCTYPLAPDVSGYWNRLKFAGELDTLVYDKEFEEIGAQLALPLYKDNIWLIRDCAFIPGLEISRNTNEDREWSDWELNGVLWLRSDNLDRIIFPESGWKGDIDAKFGKVNNSWWGRARLGMLLIPPLEYRIRKKVMTTFTVQLFGSWYDKETPGHERYSLGGLTPVGSYQLRLHDSEDLHGYKRDEFIEPFMWKAGGSVRLTAIEILILGIRSNVQLEGSIYIADAISSPSWECLISKDRSRKKGWSGGLYLDTSYLNIGFVFVGTPTEILNHLHISVVYYGFGF
ncbi:patatin-like phospholipase family protein [candidate division WOR-3 bacterium]|nr:patatin-like phospholipase family protein [candidate division WOR-3 bacterium]